MLHPSTKRLIDKLAEMTRKQRVSWTEGENGTVVHDTEGYRVVLTPEPHSVLLTDGLGREIETCLPEEFADDTDSHGRPYAMFIGELYRDAHRHARGAEKAIRTLLAGLEEADNVPAPEPEPEEQPVVALVTEDAPDATTDDTAALDSESESDITVAVASLADKINAVPPAPEEPEPVAEDLPPEPVAEAAPEPEPELVAEPVQPEPVFQAEPEPEPQPEPVIETAAPAPEDVVAEAPAPEPAEEPAPEPEIVAEAPQNVPEIPAGEEPGSFGTFGAFEPAEPDPQPAAEELPPEPVAEAAPEPIAEITPPAEPEPVPEPEPAPAAPTLAHPISLSSIPMGFGLGAAQRVPTPPSPRPQPEPEPEPVEPPRRIVIDGTVDLPASPMDAYAEQPESEPYPPPAPEAQPGDVPNDEARPAPQPGNPRRFNPWN